MSESDPQILEICSKSKALPLDDLSGAVSAYDQNSSDYFYHSFLETRDGKACMALVVFDTKNMEITNPKTWPRPRNCYRNLINCRDNEMNIMNKWKRLAECLFRFQEKAPNENK